MSWSTPWSQSHVPAVSCPGSQSLVPDPGPIVPGPSPVSLVLVPGLMAKPFMCIYIYIYIYIYICIWLCHPCHMERSMWPCHVAWPYTWTFAKNTTFIFTEVCIFEVHFFRVKNRLQVFKTAEIATNGRYLAEEDLVLVEEEEGLPPRKILTKLWNSVKVSFRNIFFNFWGYTQSQFLILLTLSSPPQGVWGRNAPSTPVYMSGSQDCRRIRRRLAWTIGRRNLAGRLIAHIERR